MTDRERQTGDIVRAKDTVIRDAAEYIKELFKDNADGHDCDHSIRVYRNAMKIASQEGDCDTFVVALAALLHDTDDHKLFHTEDNENARKFLADQGIDKDITEKICTAISEVSFSKNRDRHPSTVEGEIVQDTDRLDALGAMGIARTFAYGGKHGRSLDESVEHFHDKLLLLKDLMNTDTGKKLAESGHDFLIAFLQQYESETGGTDVIL
ncbi:MAG: HD domain-containing protein [Butyrivibrio sp.]|nr:HD domain-containing protein [Butyrivibrio sp.]